MFQWNPFVDNLDKVKSKTELQTDLDGVYVKKPSDTMGGTLTFDATYTPSPAASAVEPAIVANRNVTIKTGKKLIFDGDGT